MVRQYNNDEMKTKAMARLPGLLAQCLWRLGPRQQIDSGAGIFAYIAAILATATGLYRLCLGRPEAWTALAVAAVLWAAVLIGDLLSVLLNVDTPSDDLREAIHRMHSQDKV